MCLQNVAECDACWVVCHTIYPRIKHLTLHLNIFNRITIERHILVGGFNPSEKYEFVSWDDEIPKIDEQNVPNHQPVFIYS